MKNKLSYRHFLKLTVLILGVSFSPVAEAAVFNLDAVDSGWYHITGNHTASINNYFTGICGSGCPQNPGDHRSFFVFDVTSISDEIISATLNLFNPSYNSTDASEDLSIYDVTTSIADLTGTSTTDTAIFDDLGTGTLYGSRTVLAGDTGVTIVITLNTAALTDLNNASGLFAFGGALTSLSSSGPEYIFGNSEDGFRRLTIETRDPVQQNPNPPSSSEVPEPSSLLLAGMGLFLAFFGKKKIEV